MNKCIDCGKVCSGKRCKDCFIKFSGKKFNFGRFHFDTQKELDRTIHQLILESPMNVEFENEFFKELINTYHIGVINAKLRVLKFKILDYNNQIGKWEFARDRFRGAIYVTGFFEPINKWHGVTFYPHKKTSEKQNLILCLRQKWSELIAPKRNENQRCKCGNINPHAHHKNISFNEIAIKCLDYFSEEERQHGLGINWWLHENEADSIPNNHPAVLKLIELHKNVEYEWLCFDCHKEVENGHGIS